MERRNLIIIALGGFALLAVLAVVLVNSGTLTSGSVYGSTQCLSPEAALKFINDQGCERIYEDDGCKEKSRVEIKCPEKLKSDVGASKKK